MAQINTPVGLREVPLGGGPWLPAPEWCLKQLEEAVQSPTGWQMAGGSLDPSPAAERHLRAQKYLYARGARQVCVLFP